MNLIFHFLNARKAEEFEPNTTVFKQGDAGAANVRPPRRHCQDHGGRGGVERAGPGSIFDEMALIDDKPRSATVATRSACCAVCIGRKKKGAWRAHTRS